MGVSLEHGQLGFIDRIRDEGLGRNLLRLKRSRKSNQDCKRAERVASRSCSLKTISAEAAIAKLGPLGGEVVMGIGGRWRFLGTHLLIS